MKFPLSLLKRHLITDASLDTISATLTAIGLEVDALEDKAGALMPFVVAEILEAEKHPQADKLQVCKVKSLSGTLQIVCGAPNARAGIKVALANIGTIIPTNSMEIKKAAVRGVESQGMMCSSRELGLGDDHAGIIELPLDANIGDSIVDVLGLGDPVFDLNITANRGDCMGVYGVARDLAAAGLGTLKPLCVPGFAESGACPINITIADAEGCPAFVGRVIKGVKNGASPEWLQRALTAAGMRPISALVDITNYFSLLFARPLHVYDLAKLNGNITVRRATNGEEFLALDGKTYALNARDCVIADDSGAVGIGGVMGGEHTGVSDTTTDILLEVALFDPIRIAQTGRALTIHSDARMRFERGVDTGFLEIADARATDLIIELCGGTPTQHVVVGNASRTMPEITFDANEVNALGGTHIDASRQQEILRALGFTLKGNVAVPPTWRHDVSQPADLAEEVLRMVGYDSIPAVSLPKRTGVSTSALSAEQARAAHLRRVAAARGLHETYSWGFCSEEQAAAFGGQSDALKLLNPISAELSVMRPNILPHLIDAVKNNIARGIADVALFELGAVFHDVTPTGQDMVLSGVRAGNMDGLHWQHTKLVDVFDVKADAMAVLDAAGIDSSKCMVMPTKDAPWFHPGRSGVIAQGPKNILAVFGELHPALLKQFGVETPVFAFAVFVSKLPPVKNAKRKALTASDYQAVTRDFAFVVDDSVAAAELVKAVNAAEKQLLREVTIFDVYKGKGVEDTKKSIALTVKIQADDRTLTDGEIEKISTEIITSARKIGAVLR